MGCNQMSIVSSYRHFNNLTIFFFLLILILTQLTFTAEGRKFRTKTASLEPISSAKTVSEEKSKSMLRALIGSRPPTCERRCSSCIHCEAIQVPAANPQIKAKNGSRNFKISYSRSDESSNYKPMSWKCKCGNFIFNP